MPGHIGTSIVLNSAAILGHRPEDMTADDLQRMRDTAARLGMDPSTVSDDDLRGFVQTRGEMFRDAAPPPPSRPPRYAPPGSVPGSGGPTPAERRDGKGGV